MLMVMQCDRFHRFPSCTSARESWVHRVWAGSDRGEGEDVGSGRKCVLAHQDDSTLKDPTVSYSRHWRRGFRRMDSTHRDAGLDN